MTVESILTRQEIEEIRNQFPILQREVSGRKLVYLDNTATSQTPICVVDRIKEIYTRYNSNVHRGVHTLSQEMTDLQEKARQRVKEWINADSIEEVIFTSGTTEGINLVASSFGNRFKRGDEVVLTVMEHHANIVPWQLLRDRTGIELKVVKIKEDGTLDRQQFEDLFCERTVMAAFCHVSNVLATINPIKEMIAFSHSRNVPVLIDGAQASPHLRIDVKELDCDFYVFSAHKMYGPPGVGVLYGKKSLLTEMPPYQGGGEMIGKVTFEKTTFADLPFKFEAGTPDFVGIAAFHKAIDFMDSIGLRKIETYENFLTETALTALKEIPGIRIFGESSHRSSLISFLINNIHPYDLGMLLDKQGVAVRTGHHCAMPLMDYLGIPGTVRVSFAVYNTPEEIETFINSVKKAVAILDV